LEVAGITSGSDIIRLTHIRKLTAMKQLLVIGLLLLTLTIYGQEQYVDSKKDTSFSFTLNSECKNVLDYGEITQGISDRFIPDDRQILELTIIKNCGQTTILTVESFIDSIVVTRTDTGEMATCQCFQKCTLTIDNVYDSIAFKLFGVNTSLTNPYTGIATYSQNNQIGFYYHNKSLYITGEITEPVYVRLISLNGQVLMNTVTRDRSIAVPDNLKGLFICELKGSNKLIRKQLFIY
jgi:hypothetical protein